MLIRDYSMAMRYFGTLAALAGCFLGGATHGMEVVTYPVPAGETLSTDYEVWAEGKKVDVYTARVLDPPFAGKQWDFGGEPGEDMRLEDVCVEDVRIHGEGQPELIRLRPVVNQYMRKQCPVSSATCISRTSR